MLINYFRPLITSSLLLRLVRKGASRHNGIPCSPWWHTLQSMMASLEVHDGIPWKPWWHTLKSMMAYHEVYDGTPWNLWWHTLKSMMAYLFQKKIKKEIYNFFFQNKNCWSPCNILLQMLISHKPDVRFISNFSGACQLISITCIPN